METAEASLPFVTESVVAAGLASERVNLPRFVRLGTSWSLSSEWSVIAETLLQEDVVSWSSSSSEVVVATEVLLLSFFWFALSNAFAAVEDLEPVLIIVVVSIVFVVLLEAMDVVWLIC